MIKILVPYLYREHIFTIKLLIHILNIWELTTNIMRVSQNVSIRWKMNFYVKNTYLALVNIKKIKN
jgi:hypothetical protein